MHTIVIKCEIRLRMLRPKFLLYVVIANAHFDVFEKLILPDK